MSPLEDKIFATRCTKAVQSRRFSDKLEESLNPYPNRVLETAQIIEALIDLARELREANTRGEMLGLAADELTFYDALGANDSTVAILGDAQLRLITRQVADTVRQNVTSDWTVPENARANLRRHGYPPDQQAAATCLVVEQAEPFARAETETVPIYRR